jgi:hypothetical protein
VGAPQYFYFAMRFIHYSGSILVFLDAAGLRIDPGIGIIHVAIELRPVRIRKRGAIIFYFLIRASNINNFNFLTMAASNWSTMLRTTFTGPPARCRLCA